MIANRNGGNLRENNTRISEMVQREFEMLSFKKERYDLNYPEHAKDLTKPEIRQMAREKVIQDLCALPCCPEECPSFGNCRDHPESCGYIGR